MPKQKTVYICQSCAYESVRWLGQCPNCNSWNSLVETSVMPEKGGSSAKKVLAKSPTLLSKVTQAQYKRFSSKISEFDTVLGGGLVPGQVILLAGEPGIGKSTLLTQIAQKLEDMEVFYVCGEESMQQIKLRATRMGYKGENMKMFPETDVDIIASALESDSGSKLIIIDSIQTLYSTDYSGLPGSVGQVRACTHRLSGIAKQKSVPLILVGHVTKEGTVAGPKVLEHMVDTILYLEGDSQHLYRILKANKNRFGPVSAVGIFEMNDLGMQEVTDPSKLFLSERLKNVPGSCVTVVMEGYRPILFEIQALTSRTSFGYPRRTTSGLNVNRLQVLIATLENRCGIKLSDKDVFVNVAGGFRVTEYACDLAVCLAIASSVKNKAIGKNVAVFGECGLLGEVRPVSYSKKRIQEARKLKFSDIICPDKVKSVKQAVNLILG